MITSGVLLVPAEYVVFFEYCKEVIFELQIFNERTPLLYEFLCIEVQVSLFDRHIHSHHVMFVF